VDELYQELKNAVITGEEEVVVSLVEKALAQSAPPEEILSKGLIAGMDVVAVEFKNGDMYVPEVLVAARSMQAGNDLLKPLLAQTGSSEKKSTIVIGTVKGDLHDIGKKIVAMMLEGAGFEVIDIGIDVPVEKFIDSIKETGADIVAMSALLTTTMPAMIDVIEAMKEEGYCEKTSVMVGGAPVSDKYAKEIGAHYAYDAGAAVELAKNITPR